MSLKFTSMNKRTVVANVIVTGCICAVGVALVEFFDAPKFAYIAIGMAASWAEGEVK